MADASDRPVLQLRVALTVEDSEPLVAFYRDGLGIEPASLWTADGGQGAMFEMGQASLEVFDSAYAGFIDDIEVGDRVSGHVRLALQVPDVSAAVERALKHGALLVHPPVATPWGDRNARVEAPDGLQVTIFQAADAVGTDPHA